MNRWLDGQRRGPIARPEEEEEVRGRQMDRVDSEGGG